IDPVAIELGESAESPVSNVHIADITAGDAAKALLVQQELTALLDGWSDPEYLREIAEAVGASVRWGQGTISVTAELTDDDLHVRLIDITGGRSYVQVDWHLGSTPGPVEHAAAQPVPRTSEEHDLDRMMEMLGIGDPDLDRPIDSSKTAAEPPPYQREVGETRRSAMAGLRGMHPALGDELIDGPELAVSELVTNAKKHLHSKAEAHGLTPEEVLDVTVSGTGAGRKVTVTVTNDIAPGTSANLPPWTDDEQAWDREGGRGLQLMIAESTVAVRHLTFTNSKNTIEQSAEYWQTPPASDIAVPHSRGESKGGSHSNPGSTSGPRIDPVAVALDDSDGSGPEETSARDEASAPAVYDTANVNQAIAAQLFATFGIEVLGLDKPGLTVDTALSIRNAVVDALAEASDARPTAIVVAPLPHTHYASVLPVLDEPGAVVFLNEMYFADIDLFTASRTDDVNRGFAAAPTGDPVYDA
ncbi:MAG: ATP-binding protein, partial [Stackebrandtia sp.]